MAKDGFTIHVLSQPSTPLAKFYKHEYFHLLTDQLVHLALSEIESQTPRERETETPAQLGEVAMATQIGKKGPLPVFNK